MQAKLAIIAVAALAAGIPTSCFAKASPVTFHVRALSPDEARESAAAKRDWFRHADRGERAATGARHAGAY